MTTNVRIILLGATCAGAAALSGCAGLPGGTSTTPAPVPRVSLHGTVHGGQQPVANSRIRIYAAGSTGYGSGYSYTTGTDLLGNHVVTTDANGNFTVTGDYTCPSASTEVYFVASGGNPIAGAGANLNLALMTAVGPCGALTANTYLTINELTTVASVYALSGFMAGPANVGTSSTNAVGLTNAFATVNNLVSTSSGTLPGPSLPSGAVVPTAEINTLADIVASCINSTGGSAAGTVSDGTTCGNLFALSNNSSATAPTDTITALLNIARNPSHNVVALNGLVAPKSPFQPTVIIPSAGAWTLAVTYPGPGAGAAPAGIAADQQGNLWIANSSANTVTELNNAGAVQSGSGFTASLNAPGAIAIDPLGSPWITNKGNNTVSRLTSGGTAVSGSPYSGGGLNAPAGIAFDNDGNAWIANSGSASMTLINSGGTNLTNYSGSGIAAPIGIGITPH
jgi:hypothetical protein